MLWICNKKGRIAFLAHVCEVACDRKQNCSTILAVSGTTSDLHQTDTRVCVLFLNIELRQFQNKTKPFHQTCSVLVSDAFCYVKDWTKTQPDDPTRQSQLQNTPNSLKLPLLVRTRKTKRQQFQRHELRSFWIWSACALFLFRLLGGNPA